MMVCFLAFVLRQLLEKKLSKIGWTGSFTELRTALGRVRAMVLRGNGGQTLRLRDEVPAATILATFSGFPFILRRPYRARLAGVYRTPAKVVA